MGYFRILFAYNTLIIHTIDKMNRKANKTNSVKLMLVIESVS